MFHQYFSQFVYDDIQLIAFGDVNISVRKIKIAFIPGMKNDDFYFRPELFYVFEYCNLIGQFRNSENKNREKCWVKRKINKFSHC